MLGFGKKKIAMLGALTGAYLWLNRKGELNRVLRSLGSDVAAIQERDPAAGNMIETLTCYSGLHAILLHRMAHFLYEEEAAGCAEDCLAGKPLSHRHRDPSRAPPSARVSSSITAPESSSARPTEVGDNVTLYQGVTLGGTGKETGKRHPTLRDNVTVGAGAKVLGSVTIGENAKIGAGSIVIHDVPPNCTVVGNPGRPVRERGRKVGAADLDWTHLPDPVADAMQSLVRRVLELENEFKDAFPEKREGIEKAQEEGERELDRVFEYYQGSVSRCIARSTVARGGRLWYYQLIRRQCPATKQTNNNGGEQI